MNNIEHNNIRTFHPGYYIKDIIEEDETTQEDFASRLGMTAKHLSDLINGKSSMTNEIAKKLSLMLGTSPQVWLSLQSKYDEKRTEIEILRQLNEEKPIMEQIDYQFFVELALVNKTKDKIEQQKSLLRFLKVSSLGSLLKPSHLVQFRRSQKVDEKTLLNANAWVQTVINIGREVDTKAFSKEKLQSAIPLIREMIMREADDYIPALKKLLADCGVALVYIPSLKNSTVTGATTWLGKDKAVVGITDRGKYADIFWFSLFHELKHVLQHRITKTQVEFNDKDNDDSDYEKEADQFAMNTLIPPAKYREFIMRERYRSSDIIAFAEDINTQPGIIVGRLQRDSHIQYSRLNHLRQKCEYSKQQ